MDRFSSGQERVLAFACLFSTLPSLRWRQRRPNAGRGCNRDCAGSEPIVVYVCQGGLLRIYDTTTDQLETIPTYGQPNLAGQAVDVKIIDF